MARGKTVARKRRPKYPVIDDDYNYRNELRAIERAERIASRVKRVVLPAGFNADLDREQGRRPQTGPQRVPESSVLRPAQQAGEFCLRNDLATHANSESHRRAA